MKTIYDDVSYRSSRILTNKYSTSFSMGIRFFHPVLRTPIYSIYGFVRLGDEIVDSFNDYNQRELFDRFKAQVNYALENKISLNPILNSFQHTVYKYNIDRKWIDLFIESMEMDLYRSKHNKVSYEKYILGSAEVVGLMCLHVFCKGNVTKFNELKNSAMKLGSAYQKVNFLRDIKADYYGLGRVYFPDISFQNFTEEDKIKLINEINAEFKEAYKGILALPKESRFGVLLSYIYYHSLLHKIRRTPSNKLLDKRIRIPNYQKYSLLLYSFLRYRMAS